VIVLVRDISKIYNIKNTSLIVTYKDKKERTIIKNERIETYYMEDTEQDTDKKEL